MTEVFEKTACPGDSIAGAEPASDSAGTMAAATGAVSAPRPPISVG